MFLLSLIPSVLADETEDLAKALRELQASLHETVAAAAEVAEAEAALMAPTNEAKAHAVEWLLAYRNGPKWPPQAERAAQAPVSADFMVLLAYKDACNNSEYALELRFGLCAGTWRSLMDLGNEGWEYHATLAEIADEYRQADVAYVAARLALELNQSNANLAYQLSYYGIKARQPEGAAQAAAYAMSLEMREDVIAETALVLARTGALPIGVELLEQALTLRPNSGVFLSRQGLLFAGGGRADLASAVLQRADATGYAGADLHLAWGHTLMVLGKPEEALGRYRKAVAADPATRTDVPPELQSRL